MPRKRHSAEQIVIETFADVMLRKGIPAHIRSDNGPEMTAKVVRDWLLSSARKLCSSHPAVFGRTAIARAQRQAA